MRKYMIIKDEEKWFYIDDDEKFEVELVAQMRMPKKLYPDILLIEESHLKFIMDSVDVLIEYKEDLIVDIKWFKEK